jgi:hypothetical protein
MSESTSVPTLLTHLSNLAVYNITSCSFVAKRTSQATWIPSPSDTRLELKGLALLSADDAKVLKSTFTWKLVPRGDIPDSLLAMMPPGDVLVSQALNASFSRNRTYCHGFVATLTSDDWSRIYFLATDMDHPIK